MFCSGRQTIYGCALHVGFSLLGDLMMPIQSLPLSRNIAGTPMGIHSVLFRIWLADDSVIEPSLLHEESAYTAFGVNAGIVRFHGYAGGFEAGVYQTLRVFALPPTAITMADLLRTAAGSIRDLHARALLNAFLRNVHTVTRHGMGGIDHLRVSRHIRTIGRREGTRVPLLSTITNPRYNCHVTVVIRVDCCWRLTAPFPEEFDDVTDDYV